MMAGMELPQRAIREQIASAIQLVVHLERQRDGTRKVTHITEIQGMEGDVITMTDLFVFDQTGIEDGKVIGRLRPTGLRPKFMDQIEATGIHLPPSIWIQPSTLRSIARTKLKPCGISLLGLPFGASNVGVGSEPTRQKL